MARPGGGAFLPAVHNLSTGRQGIALHELEVPRNLLMADPTTAVLAQFFLSGLLTSPGNDRCQELFALLQMS